MDSARHTNVYGSARPNGAGRASATVDILTALAVPGVALFAWTAFTGAFAPQALLVGPLAIIAGLGMGLMVFVAPPALVFLILAIVAVMMLAGLALADISRWARILAALVVVVGYMGIFGAIISLTGLSA